MNLYKNLEGYSDPTVGSAYARIKRTERADKRGEVRKMKYRRCYSQNHNGSAAIKGPSKRGKAFQAILRGMKKASAKVKSFYRKEKQHGC